MSTATPTKTEKTNVTPAEKQKNIENHKTTAIHLEAAAKHHVDAAKHHDENNHEKAAQSTINAQAHLLLANEAQKEAIKQHAIKG